MDSKAEREAVVRYLLDHAAWRMAERDRMPNLNSEPARDAVIRASVLRRMAKNIEQGQHIKEASDAD